MASPADHWVVDNPETPQYIGITSRDEMRGLSMVGGFVVLCVAQVSRDR
jgi:hypothetical protein